MLVDLVVRRLALGLVAAGVAGVLVFAEAVFTQAGQGPGAQAVFPGQFEMAGS